MIHSLGQQRLQAEAMPAPGPQRGSRLMARQEEPPLPLAASMQGLESVRL
ncbi:MAG: hypothetical protein M3Z08_16730 [Chloroflexota bacterium]|nr:hypothetical protein [Chloroflexota bacterium]